METIFKILLVEDEYILYNRLKKFLEKKGFIVLSVPGKPFIDNYEDAIAACKDIPNLAILDIEIKGKKDGFDIGQFIREKFYTPIIFFTSKTTNINRSKSRKLLADGFIKKSVKPYDENQVLEDIEQLKPYAEGANRLRIEKVILNVQEFQNGKMGKDYSPRQIIWEQLLSISTAEDLKNYVILTLVSNKQFLYHSSLKDIEELLPPYFMKIKSGLIINSTHIEPGGRSAWQFYFNNELLEVNPTYRTEYITLLIKEATQRS